MFLNHIELVNVYPIKCYAFFILFNFSMFEIDDLIL